MARLDQHSVERLRSAYEDVIEGMDACHQARLDELHSTAMLLAGQCRDYLLLLVEIAGDDTKALDAILALMATHEAQRMPVAGHA